MKTGIAFSEHIKTEKTSRRRFTDTSDDHAVLTRTILLPIIVFIFLFLLLARLFYLQFYKGAYYLGLSDANRTRTTLIHAPRGIIFDRNHVPLVYNVPGFREIEGDTSVVISKERGLSLLSKDPENVAIDTLRQYPQKEAISHVLGYIGQMTKEELKLPEFSHYAVNDWIGKAGIEKEYESILRGVSGKRLTEVDALGREVRVLGQTDPVAGQDITLTLDSTLQEAVYKAMIGVKKGAAIVSTPKGEILAMVSKPSFDANLFTLGSEYHTSDGGYMSVESILTDGEHQPLLNRVVSGTYPPGSTFKLITAASGLEGGIINSTYKVEDTGILRVGEFSFANWFFTQYGRTDGSVDVVRAISRSNDIFFYKLAEKVGVDTLSAMGKKFGLGSVLGLDFPGEAAGVLPSRAWKQKVIGEQWYLGDTYHYGIGQGYLLTTPLQVNTWTETIANGGTLYKPNLLKNQASNLPAGRQGIKNKKFLSEKTVSLIRQGMIESCSQGGVAWPLFDFRVKNQELRSKIDNKNFLEPKTATGSAAMKDSVGISVACKTGTAQHGGEETKPHAWITLFAPAYDPQIVVTVLSEESGEGSSVAGPIAKKILESWFGKK